MDLTNIAIDVIASLLAICIIGAGLLQNFIYLVQIIVALFALKHYPKGQFRNFVDKTYVPLLPSVSMVIPAYNEEVTILESLKSILGMDYPAFEVIIVNDGSTDNTLKCLKDTYDLVVESVVPYRDDLHLKHTQVKAIYKSRKDARIRVIDKFNGGKADAQNAGISHATASLFCVMDADSILDKNAVMRAVEPFIARPAETIAVGGTILAANGARLKNGYVEQVLLPKHWIPLFQIIEYLRSFLIGRLAWSEGSSLIIISGAFGVFRRQEVIEAGGYTVGSMGEDFDLVLKLHRHMQDKTVDYRVTFVPDAICWTEVPEKMAVLRRQRVRWQIGALEVIRRYKKMLLRPRYGRVAFLGYPYAVLSDIISPFAELLGYILLPVFWLTGLLTIQYFLIFLAINIGFSILISIMSIILEEILLNKFTSVRMLAKLLLASIIENFGYRQICNWWRIEALWRSIRGRHEWGRMERNGFDNK